MATQVKKLLSIRERIIKDVKHHITTILTFTDQTKISVQKMRKQAILRTFEEFATNWTLLENCTDTKGEFKAEIETLIVENNALEDEYIMALALLDELDTGSDTSEREHQLLNSTLNHNQSSQFHAQIKLPPIKFQTFNGEFDNWEEFRDTFQACVTSRTGERELSDCQKLLYLKGTLGEEPSLLIKNLKATNLNYKAAWEILEKRYNNKRKLIYAHYRAIMDIPTISQESSKVLRTMLDTANASLSAIKTHHPDLGQLDEFFVFLLSQKLDKESRKHWEEYLKASTELPQFEQLKKFLETRFNILDGLDTQTPEKKEKEDNGKAFHYAQNKKEDNKPFNHAQNKFKGKPVKTFYTKDQQTVKCPICSKEHRIYQCDEFKSTTIVKRQQLIREKGLCPNCLFDHEIDKCKSKFTCLVCNQKHNTLLHRDELRSEMVMHVSHTPSALLATARIPVKASNGKNIMLRALIDQGSSTNLITTRAAKALDGKFINTSIPLLSIGNKETAQAQHKINCTIGSAYSEFQYATEALIIPKITDINSISIKIASQWSHLIGIELADPQFNKHGDIDMLLGVEVYSEILLAGLIKGPKNTPIAQQTKLGWILSGKTLNPSSNSPTCLFTKTETEALSAQIKRFWELEEIDETKSLFTPDERKCEKHFEENITRTEDGKYMVRLPFKINSNMPEFLGDTRAIALKRFYALERRLNSNPSLHKEYHEYIQGYIDLNHIRPATIEEIKDTKNCYFMPHHAVWKESSTSTKLRVVFDASCKSSNGYSLNDRLLVGPTIQADLFTTILNWRQYPIAFTTDITKMYRQFWVHPMDARFQRILWRINGQITQYLSHTITFGTSSAPYQAIRVLHHIADELEIEFPHVSELLRNHFYVDDCVGGGNSVEEAIQKYRDMTQTLEERGLELRKWTSNSTEFLKAVPIEHQECQKSITLPEDQTIKALGIHWNPSADTFRYSIKLPEPKTVNTKRTYLSEFAMLFDPIGWLAPSLIIPKILLQHIWIKGTNWDEPLPADINETWINLRQQFQQFTKIRIPRWIGISATSKHISLHGYADASEQAMAAVLYLRIEHADGTISSEIITSKTKVAPIKKISVPRLELNAAHLLSKLIKKVAPIFPSQIEIRAYTDSTITLCWISSHPSKWKTYIANRITLIQDIIPAEHWYHVRSTENPADCASRGILPQELLNHTLWWHGPTYLQQDQENWPLKTITKEPEEHLERRGQYKYLFHIKRDEEFINDFCLSKSSLSKLLSCTVYCLRFIKRTGKNYNDINITTTELEFARITWIKIIQQQYFTLEYSSLLKNGTIQSKSKLMPLSPFLDERQIMRVRGRLQNANLPFDQESPVILPDKGHFTWLIIEDAHHRTKHGGVQLTIQYIRQRYWIINARNTVRRQIWNCVRCFRYRRLAAQQMMGALPSPRVNPGYPFIHTGVDFAGYFQVKTSPLRQSPFVKCYISLFVCLTTKAIHLELVEDLSTEAFIAAFRRFSARRGIPSHIYSDNGTNFVGASNELPRLLTNVMSNQRNEVANCLAKDGTQWHFIPPYSPHFGGLWEAGVKSTKHHLKRVLGDHRIRAPVFYTLLAQIEAVLNSRPLCQLTADPEDISYLTPGHFLIGRPPTLVPSPEVRLISENRLSVYQQGQKIVQEFWHQWSREYLQRLQTRPKWATASPDFTIGQIVLIREDNMPPSKWMLGRILNTITGADGQVRVVDIKCPTTTIRRAIHKICALPIIDNQPSTLDDLNSSKAGTMFEPEMEETNRLNGI